MHVLHVVQMYSIAISYYNILYIPQHVEMAAQVDIL